MKTILPSLSFPAARHVSGGDNFFAVRALLAPQLSLRECRKSTAPARERRMISGRVETRAITDAEKSAGYIGVLVGVIPLNTDSVVLRDRRLNNGQPFVERIASKAFEGATDVMGMAGHTDETLAAFARQGANLTITESATEIRWEALLPNTTASRDLLELGEKKIIRGTSFEFDLGATDTWEKRNDGTAVRTVTRGKLATVNPVIWPAYDDSSLSVEARGRNRDGQARGIYAGVDYYDSNMPSDVQWACYWLATELTEFTEAQDYLRDNATGAFVEYARQCVNECSATIKTLVDWLVANGGTGAAALTARAKDATKETEQRAKDSAPSEISETPRESALRILTK